MTFVARRGSAPLNSAQRQGFRDSIEAPWFIGVYADATALQAAKPAAAHAWAMAIAGTALMVSNGSTWVAPASGGLLPDGDYGDVVVSSSGAVITVKSTAVSWAEVQGKPTFAAVATSGAYADLSGRPALSAAALSGAYADLSGRPALAAVATSGAYADLSGRPTLGTASSRDVAATGDASASQVVLGGDTRLPQGVMTVSDVTTGVDAAFKSLSAATLKSAILATAPSGGSGAATVMAWPANTAVVLGQIVYVTMMGVTAYVRSLSSRTTGATFANEAAQWSLVAQVGEGTFAGSAAVVEGFEIVYQGTKYKRKVGQSGLAGGSFSTSEWDECAVYGKHAKLITLSADVTLTPTHDDATFTTVSTSRQITVPTGLGDGFEGVMVAGPCTVVGSGVTVDDRRVSGAGYDHCTIVQIAAGAWRVTGVKA